MPLSDGGIDSAQEVLGQKFFGSLFVPNAWCCSTLKNYITKQYITLYYVLVVVALVHGPTLEARDTHHSSVLASDLVSLALRCG